MMGEYHYFSVIEIEPYKGVCGWCKEEKILEFNVEWNDGENYDVCHTCMEYLVDLDERMYEELDEPFEFDEEEFGEDHD